MATPIYKILTKEQWEALQEKAETDGAPIDVADGFIHFSNADQLQETADKHFKGQIGLILLAMDADQLGAALKWETSRGGALFPHLYAPLKLADVIWSKPLELDGETHQLPDLGIP